MAEHSFSKLIINQELLLDEYAVTDKERLAMLLNDKGIYDNTLKIPFPYTIEDAETWMEIVYKKKLIEPIRTEYAIRNQTGELIGGIGLVKSMIDQPHKNEIGYWLGRSYWGQGIMSKVVQFYSDHLLNKTVLVRIEARVFTHNKPSARVLEKAGFLFEGKIKKDHHKNGQYIDSLLYGKI